MDDTISELQQKIEQLQRRLQRERKTRQEAESITEGTTRSLYLKNLELENQQAMIRTLIEVSEEAFFIFEPEGQIIDANEEACNSLGYSYEELLGLKVSDIRKIKDNKNVPDLWKTLAPRRPLRFEDKHIRKDGTDFPVRVLVERYEHEGKNFILCHALDVSEIKAAQSEIRRSEKRARAILESMLDGLISTTPAGFIQAANPAAARLFGYPPEKLEGVNLKALIPDLFEKGRLNSLLGKIQELDAIKNDGTLFPIEVSLSELQLSDRQEVIVTFRDISERKEVDRMKDQFVSTVSHELRTPIASIRGGLGLMAGGALGALSEQAQKVVALAERNSIRLVSLINDILDHQRLKAGGFQLEIKSHRLQDIIQESLEATKGFAMEASVELKVFDSDFCVEADKSRVSQVLINLLSNAVKFSEPSSTVKIQALKQAEMIRVEVLDQGRGIPASALASIFKPFQQVNASDSRDRGGTGLGLAICKGIIERHAGEIGVESDYGQGSRFWFTLPTAKTKELD